MSAQILSLLLGTSQEKEAAQMKRKTVMVPQHSDHCPHCDFEFREKSYPRMKRDGKEVEDRAEAHRSGDYDEHCPKCDGIIDQKEQTDEEIDSNSWGMDSIKEDARKRRETQRKRREAREAKSQEKEAKCSPLETLLRKARNTTHTHPTPGQAHAGNYRKGEFSWNGLTIKLENPKGTTRRGKDKDGTEWEALTHADYGYFAGTKAADGDAVDVFLADNLESDEVFVVDQNNDAGKFDECKVLLGCNSEEEARKLYLKHYPKGWAAHIRNISTCTLDELKIWLKSGDTKKPFAEKGKKASVLDLLSLPKEAGIARMAWDSLAPFPKVQKGIKSLGAGMIADSLPVKLTASTLLGDPKILTEGPVETADRYLNKMNPAQLWKQEPVAPKPPVAPLLAKKSSALDQLLKAKEHSDAKRYTAKHTILRKLLAAAPEEFFVDSDDKAAHPGLTHKPTGFQIHAPRTVAVMAKGKQL